MIPLFFTLSYFNSHAHVERDSEYEKAVANIKISTHTLTWSVTKGYEASEQPCKFQLTRSRGA